MGAAGRAADSVSGSGSVSNSDSYSGSSAVYSCLLMLYFILKAYCSIAFVRRAASTGGGGASLKRTHLTDKEDREEDIDREDTTRGAEERSLGLYMLFVVVFLLLSAMDEWQRAKRNDRIPHIK